LWFIIVIIAFVIVVIAVVAAAAAVVVVVADNFPFKNETKVTPITFVTQAAYIHHLASQIPMQQNIVNQVNHSTSHKNNAFFINKTTSSVVNTLSICSQCNGNTQHRCPSLYS